MFTVGAISPTVPLDPIGPRPMPMVPFAPYDSAQPP
jgi:hypothetical protein